MNNKIQIGILGGGMWAKVHVNDFREEGWWLVRTGGFVRLSSTGARNMRKLALVIVGVMLTGAGWARAVGVDSLVDGFRNPPPAARPYTWWHWCGGVTKAGITADLEAMSRVGIGGFHLFNIGGSTPGIPDAKMFSPEWMELLRHTFRESARLGLEAGVQNCPGFETAGGPWITPEFGQQEVIWSETRVRGGGPVRTPLPRPAIKYAFGQWFNYADIAVVAVPLPPEDRADFRALVTKVTCTPAPAPAKIKYSTYMVPNVDVEFGPNPPVAMALVDGRLDTGFMWPVPTEERPVVVEFELREPFMARGFELGCLPVYGSYPKEARFTIEAWPPGATAYQRVGEFQVAHLRGVEDCIAPRCYLNLRPVTATKFRITFTAAKPEEVNALLPAEMVFHGLGRPLTINALASNRINDADYAREDAPAAVLRFDPAQVVDVSRLMAADGTLLWDAPAGDWLVLRLGHSCTGSPIKPVPNGMEGIDCDKMSKAAFDLHFEKGIKPYLDAAGDLVGKTFTTILFDSMECEWQNWTAAMPAEFARRRGYSIIPYLPAFANLGLTDKNVENEFNADFSQTLSDLFQENFFDYSCEVIHRHGLQVAREPYSTGCFSAIKAGRRADVPMTEFWMNTRRLRSADGKGGHYKERLIASIARQYGQRYVGAEAFTQGEYVPYEDHPYTMKPFGDEKFARGINRFYFHTYAHQPFERVPGVNMGPWGFQMNRHQTWWELAGPYMKYLARCNWLLQEGDFVGDILVWTPDETFYAAGYLTSSYWKLQGYDYTVIASDTFLKTRLTPTGRIEFAPRQDAAVLVLTWADRMSVEELRHLARLVEGGVVLIGPPPQAVKHTRAAPHSEWEALVRDIWGKQRPNVHPVVINEKNYAQLEKILQSRRVPPDVEIPGAALDADARGFHYIHRRNADADWYFLSNQEPAAQTVTAIFRAAGRRPELWHPDTGKIEPVDQCETLPDGRVRMPLAFDPHGSLFVVFRSGTAATGKTGRASVLRTTMPLDTGWGVTFQPGRGAPERVQLHRLQPLSEHPDDGVRYFSGMATYTRRVELPAEWLKEGRRVELDLGQVGVIAEVKVNDQVVETLWKPPFVTDITAALRPGANELAIRVANTWLNRLQYEAQLPSAKRLTWTNVFKWEERVREVPTPKSGLIGPVVLKGYQP